MSSEYVFSGEGGNYREDDSPNPITHYGRTKFQAEQAIAREASKWSIVRTSLVFGWPLIGRQNLATRIMDRLKNGSTFDGHVTTYRTPIFVEHLTEGIVQLIARYHPGIYHLAGADWVNMYQFASTIAEVSGLDSSLVTPIQVLMEVPSKTDPSYGIEPDHRPDMLGLDCRKTCERLGLCAFGLVAGVEEMLA